MKLVFTNCIYFISFKIQKQNNSSSNGYLPLLSPKAGSKAIEPKEKVENIKKLIRLYR